MSVPAGRCGMLLAVLSLSLLAHAASARVLHQDLAPNPAAPFAGRRTVAELGILPNVGGDQTIPCTKAAVCDPAWATAAAATVSMYLYRDTVDDDGEAALDSGLCTGTLVGGPDPSKVYVLSAVHCFANRTDVSQFSQWLLLFNWDAAACSQPPAMPELVTEVDVMARALKPVFVDEASDVFLMELTAPIPDSFGAKVLSVQPTSVPPVDAVVIHHPIGSYKHISYARSKEAPGGTAVEGLPQTTLLDKQLVRVGPSDHWMVKWTDGVTQGGSSGSALIDAATGAVVGVLSGGSSTCGGDEESNHDYYGRIDAAWAQGLWQFFSDAPPPNVTAEDVQSQIQQVALASGVNAEPLAFVLSADDPSEAVRVWWGDPIPAGGSVSVKVGHEVVSGGMAAGDFELAPASLAFTAQGVSSDDGDYTNAQTLNVSIAAGAAVRDGTVLMITLTPVDASGAPLPDIESLQFKAIVANWTLEDDIPDQPAIPALPYSAEAPLSSPLGRALWEYSAPADQLVDVAVCKAAALNATATALAVFDAELEAGPIAAVGDTPEGDGCIGIQGVPLTGGRSYLFMLSDYDVLLFVLPISDVSSFSLSLAEPATNGTAATGGAAAAAPAAL